MKWKSVLLVLLLVAAIVVQPACYGSFNLTRQVLHLNSNLGNKWLNEGVFIVFIIIPVYGFAMLGDAIIFNVFEFWGGENPIHSPDGGTAYREMSDGDLTARLARLDMEHGRRLEFRLHDQDRLVHECIIETRDDGTALKKDADGNVLATARPTADGNLLVRDAGTGLETVYTREDLAGYMGR
jgi:hypothetical protein